MPRFTRDMTPRRWFFLWQEGGYNNVLAESREEAIVLATAIGAAVPCVLHPDLSTLVLDLKGTRTAQEDARYAGVFD